MSIVLRSGKVERFFVPFCKFDSDMPMRLNVCHSFRNTSSSGGVGAETLGVTSEKATRNTACNVVKPPP